MHIYSYGQSCFKFEEKNATIVVDPFTKVAGLTAPKFKADLVLLTNKEDTDASNFKDLFRIEGPGEYEVRGIRMMGASSNNEKNTIYKLIVDGIKLAHLGAFNEKVLSENQLEMLGDIDILLLPIGGKSMIGYKEAADVVKQLEPKIVIPMYYKTKKARTDLEGPEKFLKEIGLKAEYVEKLRIVKKDLPQEKEQLIVFNL